MTKAQYLLQQKTYNLWTDKRRTLAYDTESTQEDRDKEPVQLLKIIADMEVDNFPSHIIEEIKNTLSIDSLHLDEIEEMNLNNIQKG
ncbi:hypothetical protein Gotur_016600 [Gossypium turneri]